MDACPSAAPDTTVLIPDMLHGFVSFHISLTMLPLLGSARLDRHIEVKEALLPAAVSERGPFGVVSGFHGNTGVTY